MVDSDSSQRIKAYGAGWEGDGSALRSDSRTTQLAFQTSRQVLMNPEGDLMIFVREKGWWMMDLKLDLPSVPDSSSTEAKEWE